MQLGEVYRETKQRLIAGGIPEADTETRIILRETAAVDMAMLMGHPELELPDETTAQIEDIIIRRLRREPLQYIYGKWSFMGLDFYVEPEVLIPRSDTELLVEEAMKRLHSGMRILDLCTGTGCVLISLLKYSNDCSGTGVDISRKAVGLAMKNAGALLDSRAEAGQFVCADLYDGAEGMYDMIVSNPPYIPTEVIDGLEPEVRDYEPHLALDGGADGLDLYKRIIFEADKHLIPGGDMLLEIGCEQKESVCSLMEKTGFVDVVCLQDYAGLDRVVMGTRAFSYE